MRMIVTHIPTPVELNDNLETIITNKLKNIQNEHHWSATFRTKNEAKIAKNLLHSAGYVPQMKRKFILNFRWCCVPKIKIKYKVKFWKTNKSFIESSDSEILENDTKTRQKTRQILYPPSHLYYLISQEVLVRINNYLTTRMKRNIAFAHYKHLLIAEREFKKSGWNTKKRVGILWWGYHPYCLCWRIRVKS